MSALGLVLPNDYLLSVGVSFLPTFAIISAAVVMVVATRNGPDPDKQRPLVVYLCSASFFLTIGAAAASYGVVSSLTRLISWVPLNGNANGGFNNGNTYYPYPLHLLGDAVARGASLGGLLLIVTLFALGFHERRARSLAGADSSSSSQVVRSYDALVCFIAVFAVVLGLAGAIYGLCQVIAPGVFEVPGRSAGFRSLLDSLWVFIVGAVVLRSHLRHAGLSLLSMHRRASSASEAPAEAH